MAVAAERPIKIPRSPHYREDLGEGYPCVVCGKHIPEPKYMVHLVEGGSHALHPDFEPYDRPEADLGWYPLGADCLRQHPELRPYVYK